MKRIAKFHQVSFQEFTKSFPSFETEKTRAIYEQIPLPKRATKKSAGYDFFLPYAITLEPKETITIPTGIRVEMEGNWVLQIFPRSSLGFKYQLQLNNTVGIIDADYFYSDNEGHIFIRMTNHSTKTLELAQGTGFAQGVFIEYGITIDDDVQDVRSGGLGSTNKA